MQAQTNYPGDHCPGCPCTDGGAVCCYTPRDGHDCAVCPDCHAEPQTAAAAVAALAAGTVTRAATAVGAVADGLAWGVTPVGSIAHRDDYRDVDVRLTVDHEMTVRVPVGASADDIADAAEAAYVAGETGFVVDHTFATDDGAI